MPAREKKSCCKWRKKITFPTINLAQTIIATKSAFPPKSPIATGLHTTNIRNWARSCTVILEKKNTCRHPNLPTINSSVYSCSPADAIAATNFCFPITVWKVTKPATYPTTLGRSCICSTPQKRENTPTSRNGAYLMRAWVRFWKISAGYNIFPAQIR